MVKFLQIIIFSLNFHLNLCSFLVENNFILHNFLFVISVKSLVKSPLHLLFFNLYIFINQNMLWMWSNFEMEGNKLSISFPSKFLLIFGQNNLFVQIFQFSVCCQCLERCQITGWKQALHTCSYVQIQKLHSSGAHTHSN